jgi:PAS domain S-box-containing protein
VAVLVAILTAVVRWQFLGVLELRAPFVTFFPAVTVAALYGGFWGGLLATLVSAALADYFWIEPVGHFTISNFADQIATVIFVGSGFLISCLAEAAFRAQARANKAAEESRLAAELEKAAVALQQSEEAVRESEACLKVAEAVERERQRLFDVLETLPIMVCLLKPDYKVVFANRSFREKFGDAHGRRCYEYRFGGSEPCAFCEITKVLKTGLPHHWEFTGPDGTLIDAHDFPFTDVDGSPMVLEMHIDITERKQAEEERVSHLTFLECMDQINRAMQGTNDLEQMIGNVLNAMLSIFDSDRAFLDYPCDPDAVSFEVVMERTRPEYPRPTGVIPTPPDTARNFRLYLASSRPVTLGPGCDYPLEVSHYGQKSQIVTALYPKTGKPWLLGTHQCSYPRVWTQDEKKLLNEIARRMTDVLTSLLAHRDLHESEERYRVILRTAMDGFFRTDMQGQILEVNETYCRMSGYSEQELLTMNVADISAVRTAETIAADIRRFAEGGPQRFESVHRRKDGSLFDVEIGAQYQPIASGQAVVFVRDITERKRAEEALRQSEAYLAESQRLTHTGSWGFDLASGKYIYSSEESSRIYEFDPQERPPSEEAILQRIHPEDRDGWKSNREKSLREKVDTSDEYRIVLPDGTVKYIHAIRHPVLNDAGDIVQLVGTSIDITERKRAEEALRQSEAYLAEAQRLTHTGSWAVDLASDKYIYASEEDLRIFGFNPQEPLPTREAVFRLMHPEDRDRVEESFQETFRKKIDTSCEYRIVLPDGTVKHIHVIRHPVLNSSGEIIRLIGTSMDVTERKRAEEALRASEHKYRELVENANSIILRWNSRGDITFLNEFGQKFFGYQEDEILGRNVVGTITPEIESTGRDLRPLMAKICENPTVFEQNINENMLRDGSRVWIAWTNKTAFDAEGKLIEVLSIGSDITERKCAEEALRQSEAYLTEAQRLSHTGSWALDVANGKYDYWSEETFRIYEFDPQEGLPTKEAVYLRIHPEDLDIVKAGLEKSIREKVDTLDEFRIVLPSGTVKHIQVIRHPVPNDAGNVVKLVGTLVDITERKRAEEALQLAGVYNRSLIEASLDPLVTIDPEGRISDVNAATEQVTGYARSELIGTHFSDYFTEPEKARRVYGQVIGEGLVRDYELNIRHRDGRITPALCNASVYRDEAGKVIGVSVAARDITERKQAQEALQKLLAEMELRVEERTKELSEANQSLQAANKELESFTYSVSHDLRAPLRAIDGFSMMVLKGYADKLDDEGRRKLNVVRSNTQQMGRLIDDLLAFSRMGRKEMVRANLDMEALVRSAWRELTLLNPERRIQFSVQRLPYGMGDQTLIKEVVVNLLSNAIKFTKYRENAIVEVGAFPEEEADVYFVRDNGVGFDMQYYDKLFGVFQRLHSTDEFEGTGVGLAIVERIIGRHGGRVWAEGKEGEGATLYFTLPKRGNG